MQDYAAYVLFIAYVNKSIKQINTQRKEDAQSCELQTPAIEYYKRETVALRPFRSPSPSSQPITLQKGTLPSVEAKNERQVVVAKEAWGFCKGEKAGRDGAGGGHLAGEERNDCALIPSWERCGFSCRECCCL